MNQVDTRSTEEILQEKGSKWLYIKTDKNGTRYFESFVCPKCNGKGKLIEYKYIDNGTCYECGGAGVVEEPEIIKIFTPKHEEELAKRREYNAKYRKETKEKEAIKHRDENLQKQGFAREGEEWVIYRVIGDTYEIKDVLKELGCKFNKAVGWYRGTQIDGYQCQRLTSTEVLVESIFIEWKEKEEIQPLLYETTHKEIDKSEWQGTLGARIEIVVDIKNVMSFNGKYGYSFVYIMRDEFGNVYKWTTAKELEKGCRYRLKATVKDFAEYNGVKQTIITRATAVKEV